MSQSTTPELRTETCPTCYRPILDTETALRCSHPGCEVTAFECCSEMQECEGCKAVLCEVHAKQYVTYVLCDRCHIADRERINALVCAVLEMDLNSRLRQRTEQDGRRWTGYIGCEDLLDRLSDGIENGTIAPEVIK